MKKKKVSDNSKPKRILFKKNKRKIIELKSSKKIKEILPEKIESGLEKEIEDTIPRFKDILKKTESSPVLERIAVAESQENLEREITSASISEKEKDEKINYFSNSENSIYLSEINKSETSDFEYPSSADYAEISAGTITPGNRRDFNKRINETRLTRQEFLDPMAANRTNVTGRNQERTFEVHDKKYIDAKEEEKKYEGFKQ